MRIDEEAKKKVGELDGCYCIKTDLSQDVASKEEVHERYKSLIDVEQAFRTMKTGLLEGKLVYVRREKRTRGDVFVVMLSFIITQELKRVWKDLEVRIEEGLNELAVVTSEEIKIGKICYQQIPEPRELGRRLLKTASVTLPEVLPYRNINVATRKKLITRQK